MTNKLNTARFSDRVNDKLMQLIESLFEKYEEAGRITFEYETKIYCC